MRTGLTLSGALMVIAVAYINLRHWYRGSRDAKALVPFGAGFLLGAMGTMCPGGLLGWLSNRFPAIANRAGDKAVTAVTGADNSTPVAPARLGDLGHGGGAIVFLSVVAAAVAFKAYGKAEKKRLAGGLFCGAAFCVTAAAASLLDWLPGLINETGDQLAAALQGAV